MPKQIDTQEVRALAAGGAQLVEVLPPSAFEREHLPRAVNVPFTDLDAQAVLDLDHDAPTVVYCYDHECDLSARAAHRLEALGFTDVYDYTTSKAAWMAYGLPIEGTVRPQQRAGAVAQPTPCGRLDQTVGDLREDLEGHPRVVITTDDDVVLGVVRAEAAMLDPHTPVADVLHGSAPSVRPSITTEELAESMDRDQRTFVLVTTPDGLLIGVIERDQLLGRS